MLCDEKWRCQATVEWPWVATESRDGQAESSLSHLQAGLWGPGRARRSCRVQWRLEASLNAATRDIRERVSSPTSFINNPARYCLPLTFSRDGVSLSVKWGSSFLPKHLSIEELNGTMERTILKIPGNS